MRQEEETLRDQEWKDFFKVSADSVSLDEEKKERIFAEVQKRIQERSQNMYKIKKKKTMFVAAAAAAVMLGTITAVGAGTVEGLFTSIRTDQVDYRSGKEMKAAERVMGAVPKAPDQFSNGLEFQAGYLTSVNGADESGTIVESYPGISVSYGEDVSLFIEKVPDSMKQENRDADAAAEYKGIQLELTADPYLFLPPDAEPSAEDQKLEQEGKLYISYGTDEEVHEMYQMVSWEEDGLSYMLSTFSDAYGFEDLIQMAQEVIDTETE